METKAQDLFDMGYTTIDGAETENGGGVFEISALSGNKIYEVSGKVVFSALQADFLTYLY